MTAIKDVMTADVTTIDGSATVTEAVKLMQVRGLTSLVVCDERTAEDVYALVSSSDIVHKVFARGKNPAAVTIGEIASGPCPTLDPGQSVAAVVRLFARLGIDRAAVVRGKLLGTVSGTDLLLKGNLLGESQDSRLRKARREEILEKFSQALGIDTRSDPFSFLV